jgi:hypothetical protein
MTFVYLAGDCTVSFVYHAGQVSLDFRWLWTSVHSYRKVVVFDYQNGHEAKVWTNRSFQP